LGLLPNESRAVAIKISKPCFGRTLNIAQTSPKASCEPCHDRLANLADNRAKHVMRLENAARVRGNSANTTVMCDRKRFVYYKNDIYCRRDLALNERF